MQTVLLCMLCAGGAVLMAEFIRRFSKQHDSSPPRYALADSARDAALSFRRLFAAEESRFLEEFGDARRLRRRLRRNRQAIFVALIQQMQAEYSEAAADLRRLAVELDQPELARDVFVRTLSFQGRCLALRLQLALGVPATQGTIRWVTARAAANRPARAVVSGAQPAQLPYSAVR